MFKLSFFFIGLFLLFSCTRPPKIEHPKLENLPNKNWEAASPVSGKVATTWWTDFGDSNLTETVKRALNNNYSLKIAAANIEAAKAQATIAGAPLYPNLSVANTASKRKQIFVGLPIPNAPPGSILSSTSTVYGLSGDVSWELDLWGRVRAAKSAANAQIQATKADFQAARLSICGQTTKAWLAAVEGEKQVQLAASTLENFTTTRDQINTRYEKGLRPSIDLMLAETNVSTAESFLVQRSMQAQQALRQLEVLLGKYPAAVLEISNELPQLQSDVPTGLPTELLSRRPDLYAAERMLAASKISIKQAKLAFLPRLALSGSRGTSTPDYAEVANQDFLVWNIAGNIVQPIFQGGRLWASVSLAKAQNQQALASYATQVLTAFAEVENAMAAENFLSRQQETLVRATNQALNSRQLAESRYYSGVSDLITMLEAQRRAFDAQSQLLNVQRLRLEARVNLYLALGGGFAEDMIK
ncbi:MAG: hypothetical protein DWQ05_04530 [Calditrichaeota bacterium]|nr:MAG: hypothetical protein DWQ05_04530 [Calditrichota bacterium]